MKTVKEYRKYLYKLFVNKQFSDALEIIEEKRLKNKNNSFFYSMYGICHLYMDYLFEARLYINKALEMNPQDPDALNALAYLHLKENNINEAIQLYLKILDIYPDLKHVKSNLNRFKGKNDLDKILNNLKPEQYMNPNVLSLEGYQKVLMYTLISILLLIIIFNIKDLTLNFENKIPITYREHFKNILYNQEHNQEHLINNFKDRSEISSIRFNEFLNSNFSIENKVKVEHLNRKFIIEGSEITPLTLSKLIQIESKPFLYHYINYKFKAKLVRTISKKDYKYLDLLYNGKSIKILITKGESYFNRRFQNNESYIFIVKLLASKSKDYSKPLFRLMDIK